MISNVPVEEGDAERMFAAHFDREGERRGGGRPPGAGGRRGGQPAASSDGTALPLGETLTEENTSSRSQPKRGPKH